MNEVTPAVCQRGSGGGLRDATERRRKYPRKQHVIWARGPVHRARTGAREAARRRPAGGATRTLPEAPSPTLSVPQRVGARRWGPAGGGRGLGGRGLGSLPLPAGRGRRLGSEAAGGHFSCGAAEGPGGPSGPAASALSPSRPTGAAAAAGRERPRSWPAAGRGSGSAGGGGRGGVVSAGSGRRGEQGKRRERAGSRYLYWAAAAAAAAPLWVNPKQLPVAILASSPSRLGTQVKETTGHMGIMGSGCCC